MDSDIDFINWFNGLEKQDKKELTNSVKDYLLSTGKYDVWRNVQFAKYSKFISENTGSEFFHKYQIYLGVEDNLSFLEDRCCKQIYDSNRQRSRRLKNKLLFQLSNYNCLFLTLTFTDDILCNTSHQTRRDYIRRYLKSLGCTFYCANIDFGDKEKNPDSKEREHYHAIINIDYIDLNTYKYGFIYAEKIRSNSSLSALSKYINKLTCHAYKDSTKGRDRLIYSR